MAFSAFLKSRRCAVRELVDRLSREFDFVSVLGSDVRMKNIKADRNTTDISVSGTQCGFVVKMSNSKVVYEYSMDDISGDVGELAEKIISAYNVNEGIADKVVSNISLYDEPLVQSFCREHDFDTYTDSDRLDFCKEQVSAFLASGEHVVNAVAMLRTREVSSLYISKNRELDQNYGWVNGLYLLVYKENDKVLQPFDFAAEPSIAATLKKMLPLRTAMLERAHHLAYAKSIEPGIYDIVTDSSVTGLIAHEAFGHGVEMDQFIKDRALAKDYVGKYVASPICNMRDGAAATLSAASFFFDDDGVLAGDTQIIKDGVLVAGLCDATSASELGVVPTGNGRRQSTRRKAYSRMTNTFFEKGTDKLEDMIASIKHGYMLFGSDNGMEDPKNWAIQCTAAYGIEIVDGKLTDNYVAPVVMSGYVPDLLKSISMISDTCEVHGAGMCGKGYKEWVYVSDGGPSLKARVKLG